MSIRLPSQTRFDATSTSGTQNVATWTPEFVQNSLVSVAYETLPLGEGHMPGYTGHQPGRKDAIAQRPAAASVHAAAVQQQTRDGISDLSLVDLRPEQRALNKNYMYAENSGGNFMQFPTKKTFDHRRN